MSKTMESRVYGVVGVSSIMANFNADFSGYPKVNSDNEVFGSDKALKFPMKKLWQQEGEKVLYIKSMILAQEAKNVVLKPKTLAERYEELFEKLDDKSADSKKVLKNLFSAIDVKNFGATFAEKNNNIAITGAVQFGQGFNKYEGHQAFEQPILSPFRDPKAKEKKGKDENGEETDARNSTIGTKILSNEAHYFFPFSVNPSMYDDYVAMGDITEGYTEEDFAKLKKALLSATTAFSTNSKAGCDNEFLLLVKTEQNAYLPNLDGYIKFDKGTDQNKITIVCDDMLNRLQEKIKSIEIYYNPYTTVLQHQIKGAQIYNILTQSEV